jgi:prepilin-type N-terminal cleavage/methylation domain-containing protein
MRTSFKKRNTKGSGFTLVETLVAIAILMIAIAGPLTVAEKGLSAAIYARDQLMASYLAQDGLEYAKNIVDTNRLNIGSNPSLDTGDYWIRDGSYDLSTYCTSSLPCTIDTISGAVSHCTGSSPIQCQALTLGSGDYAQSGSGQTSSFTRYFYVQGFNVNGGSSNNTNNAANVVVTVIWPGDVTGGGGVTLEDTLFDTPIQ